MNAPVGRSRKAFVFAYCDRLLVMGINLATLLITARLLTPKEFGIAVLGFSLIGLADILRDFGGSAYVVQAAEVSEENLRTVFTVTLALTMLMAGGLWLLSSPIETFLGTDGVGAFVRLGAATMLVGPFAAPIFALLRRQLDFAVIASISVTTAVANGIATIVFALSGLSFMSFAWANLLSTVLGLALCLYYRPIPGLYRPCISEWRLVGAYGAYESGRAVLLYLVDAAPHLALGRFLGAEAVGLFQRAQTVARLSERILLAGLAPALLPVLSEQARGGRDLKAAYLSGIEHVTVLIWPSLVVLIILSEPLVRLLLGSQWLVAVPLVRILAGAYLLWFNMNLTNPLLISLGAIRDTFKLALFAVPLCVLIQIPAAQYGPQAMAWSAFATVPIFVTTSLIIVRRHIPFSIRELGSRLWRSLVIAVASGAPPLAATLAARESTTMPYALLVGAIAFAIGGWIAGVIITGHPIRKHMMALVDRARRYAQKRGSAKERFHGTRR